MECKAFEELMCGDEFIPHRAKNVWCMKIEAVDHHGNKHRLFVQTGADPFQRTRINAVVIVKIEEKAPFQVGEVIHMDDDDAVYIQEKE